MTVTAEVVGGKATVEELDITIDRRGDKGIILEVHFEKDNGGCQSDHVWARINGEYGGNLAQGLYRIPCP